MGDMIRKFIDWPTTPIVRALTDYLLMVVILAVLANLAVELIRKIF